MNKSAEYHLKITTTVREDPRDIALEFDQNRTPSTWAVVDTEIKCKSPSALAKHLRIIADELDPQPPAKPSVNLVHPHYRSTNA